MTNRHWKRKEWVYLHSKVGGIFRPEAGLGVNTNWQAIDTGSQREWNIFPGPRGADSKRHFESEAAEMVVNVKPNSAGVRGVGGRCLSSHITNHLKDFSISAKFISACERWKKSALASRNVCDVHEFGLWQTTGEREVFAVGAQCYKC